jgi:toxin ParE1/3/4
VTVRIVRSAAARRDIIEHAVYISNENPSAGDRFLDAVQAAFTRICQFPLIGAARRFRSPILRGVRMWPTPGFERYLLFYRLEDNDEQVRVLRVLNGARNDIADALRDID